MYAKQDWTRSRTVKHELASHRVAWKFGAAGVTEGNASSLQFWKTNKLTVLANMQSRI